MPQREYNAFVEVWQYIVREGMNAGFLRELVLPDGSCLYGLDTPLHLLGEESVENSLETRVITLPSVDNPGDEPEVKVS